MRERLGATVALAIAVLVLWAAPAMAHVAVDASRTSKGSPAKLTFRVLSGWPPRATVKFAVMFDENHPIAIVSVEAKVLRRLEPTRGAADTTAPCAGGAERQVSRLSQRPKAMSNPMNTAMPKIVMPRPALL